MPAAAVIDRADPLFAYNSTAPPYVLASKTADGILAAEASNLTTDESVPAVPGPPVVALVNFNVPAPVIVPEFDTSAVPESVKVLAEAIESCEPVPVVKVFDTLASELSVVVAVVPSPIVRL